MRKPDENRPTGHPSALFLEYVEDRLSQEDRAMIEQHIHTCEECSAEVQGIEQLITHLKTNKEAFCPEPWQWHEYVERGADAKGELNRHLEGCVLCSEEVAALSATLPPPVLPKRVRVAVEEQFRKRPTASQDSESGGLRSRFLEWLSGAFQVPAMALGAVAAAILVTLLVYPRGGIESTIGLSSVTWGPSGGILQPKGGIPEERKPRVAVLLVFKGFKEPLPQEKIDALYEAIKPGSEMTQRYDFVPPAELRDAIEKDKVKPTSASAALAMVAQDLDISRGLLVTISLERSGFLIEAELLELPAGTPIRREALGATATDQLSERLKDVLSIVDGRPQGH